MACGDGEAPPVADASPVETPDAAPLPPTGREVCANIDMVPGELVGCVVDLDGNPIAGATITVDTLSEESDADGVFVFAERPPRGNHYVTIDAEGYKRERLIVSMVPNYEIAPIPVILTPVRDSITRFVFGGDVSFGRRYLDSDEGTPRGQMPADDPDALILVSDPLPGSLDVVERIRPIYQEADIGVVNLESPVTDNPETPHPTKLYAFFTLPSSVDALKYLGVDYVSLGNNHVYDYLELGLQDTIRFLDAAGVPHSGAGQTEEEAFAPEIIEAGEHTYAMMSSTSISGVEHGANYTYVADPNKGGAADLRQLMRVSADITAVNQSGAIPIAQFHTGFEYTFSPEGDVLERMRAAAEAGAALVIGHHTHVAQGFGFHNGVILAHCLGNLIFDQDRVETMLGIIARFDMDGRELLGARAIPVYIEDYRPRPIGGELADRLMRRLAEFSHGHGATVMPYHGQGWVARAESPVIIERRTITVDVAISENGWAAIDLRKLAAADESVEKAESDRGDLRLRLGRDVMLFGDMEDWDLDEDDREVSRWDIGSATTVCDQAWRGASALCSSRTSTNTVPTTMFYRNRVRVMGDALGMPNKELTLIAHAQGNNAGPVSAQATYTVSEGDREFGDDLITLFAPGDYNWTMAAIDLNMPPDVDGDPIDPTIHPRAVKLRVRHAQPESGTGILAIDDLALVNWEDEIGPGGVSVPHGRDFIRVEGAPGRATINLTLTRLRPALAE